MFRPDADIQKDVTRIRQSKCFDEAWYMESYKDVAMLGMDPIEHYVKFGHLMLRDPSADFSCVFYQNTHRVVQKTKLNPFMHFLSRKPKPHANPDPRCILWAAGLVSMAGNTGQAIDLAEKYLPKEHTYTANILKANHAAKMGNEALWLNAVNNFLASYDIAPLTLSGATGSILHRFGAAELLSINTGPLISVIMPAWNAERTIETAISSILRQTWRPLELIIVDDASTDTTWEKMKRAAEKDTRIKIVQNSENVGPYVSKNIALEYATGAYITGQDADDWAHPQRLEKHIDYLLSENQITSLSGMLRIDPYGQFTRLSQIGPNTEDGACVAGFISMMCERNFFRTAVGNWDEMRFGGDSELIKRLETALGKVMRRHHSVGMFCLDNPEGLTNHPEFGHRPGVKISPTRRAYKASFQKWHQTRARETVYLSFPQKTRSFEAPKEALNPKGLVQSVYSAQKQSPQRISERKLSADVCIVTNLRFPGGNASSTLDEIRYFIEAGKNVLLVHCPVDADLGKAMSERYDPYMDKITNFHDFSELRCQTLIVRHPAVACSYGFNRFKSKLIPQNAYFVINNSKTRTNGAPVYSVETVLQAARSYDAPNTQICPISPLMRDELEDAVPHDMLSDMNWTPTFDLEAYQHKPKPRMKAPFIIGRHGRDGAEKWLADKSELLKAYPNSDEFTISILGGARNTTKILGPLPSNWQVHDFGSITPKEYLKALDAFVYFPNTNLNEGFGRTIAEAMIAGVPCILPPKFELVFEHLAFYCAPGNVSQVIHELAKGKKMRTAFLNDIQDIAIQAFSTKALGPRFEEWFDKDSSEPSKRHNSLKISSESAVFRDKVMNSVKKDQECA